jgi:hypothetical protein
VLDVVGLLEVLPRAARLFQTCLFLNEIGGFAPSLKKTMDQIFCFYSLDWG